MTEKKNSSTTELPEETEAVSIAPQDGNTPSAEEIARAVEIVNKAITLEREKYKKISDMEEQEPVLLEGITFENY